MSFQHDEIQLLCEVLQGRRYTKGTNPFNTAMEEGAKLQLPCRILYLYSTSSETKLLFQFGAIAF